MLTSRNKKIVLFLCALFFAAGHLALAQAAPQASSTLEEIKKANAERLKKLTEQIEGTQRADDTNSRCVSSYRSQVGGAPSVGSNVTYVEDRALIQYTGQVGKLVDTNTGQTSQYSQMICRHVFSLRRMERDMERKTFIENPGAIQQSVESIEKQKEEFAKFFTVNGRDTDGDGVPDGSFIPANLSDHYYTKDQEEIAVFKDDIKNSSNFFKNIINAIVDTDTDNNLLSSLEPTITPEEYSKFVSHPEELSADEYQRIAAEYYGRSANNPIGTLTAAHKQLNIRRNIARQQEELEIQRNQGTLDNERCVELTGAPGDTNRACRKWVTVQPGSVLRDHYTALLNARLARTIATDDSNEYIPYAQPNLPEIIDPANIGQYGFPKDNDGDGLLTGDDDDLDGDGTINKEDGDIDGDGVPNDIDGDPYDPAVRGDKEKAPEVTLTLTRAQNGQSARLNWDSKNADECLAANTWLTAAGEDYPEEVNFLAFKDTTNVGTKGTVDIKLPLNFEIMITRLRGTDENPDTGENIRAEGVQLTTLTINDVTEGDQFKFGIKTAKEYTEGFSETGYLTPTSFTPEGVVSLISSIIEGAKVQGADNIVNKYTWTFTGNKIQAKTDGLYSIRCSNFNGEAVKTVSLTPES
jgi:hypothetical protein